MKPLARYAALSNFVELSLSLGLDPGSLIRDAGLDPASLSMPDRWVPAGAIADLLERAARASGHDDFGLKLAELRRLSNLGPLSLAIREEPDVRSALKILMRYEHMYNEALHTRISERNGIATIRIELELGHPGEVRQSRELAVGVLHRLLSGFLGTGWQPLGVSFTHPAPQDQSTHRQVFGRAIKFEQEFNGIVLYTDDLESKNAMSDPLMRPYAQQFLGSIEASREATTLNRVRELIELLLPTGRCSVEQVARSLGVDRRTVHRRLSEEGHTFSSLLDATRAALAEHMVGTRRYSLTEIAEMLAFSSPSNFSRWFGHRFGCNPSQWRSNLSSNRLPDGLHDTTPAWKKP